MWAFSRDTTLVSGKRGTKLDGVKDEQSLDEVVCTQGDQPEASAWSISSSCMCYSCCRMTPIGTGPHGVHNATGVSDIQFQEHLRGGYRCFYVKIFARLFFLLFIFPNSLIKIHQDAVQVRSTLTLIKKPQTGSWSICNVGLVAIYAYIYVRTSWYSIFVRSHVCALDDDYMDFPRLNNYVENIVAFLLTLTQLNEWTVSCKITHRRWL